MREYVIMRFLLAKLSVYRSGRQATRVHEASELTVHLRWHSAVETIALNVIRHLSGSKLHTRSPHSQGGWLAHFNFFLHLTLTRRHETRGAGMVYRAKSLLWTLSTQPAATSSQVVVKFAIQNGENAEEQQ